MILGIRDAFDALRAPVSEAVAYASYLSAQAAVRFAELRLAQAQADLELAIVSRDAALAAVRQSEPPPRVLPAFLLRKDDNGTP